MKGALLLLPCVLTCCNLAAGFAGLVLASQGAFWGATGLVALAALLDTADGILARRGSAEGEFGANLDSLADVVSFGAAPALALYLGALRELDPLGFLASAAFVVCGAVRLARFPLVRRPDCYAGLPIPPAGLALALLAAASPPPALALLATVLLGALMVSRVPFPVLGVALPVGTKRGLAPEEPPEGRG
jgi:CDP-diacylglycerol--serine O-phosphatidyltransferase